MNWRELEGAEGGGTNLELAEEHGGDLLGGEGAGLAAVVDVEADGAIRQLPSLDDQALELLLRLGVLELAPDEALEVRQRVLAVHHQLPCNASHLRSAEAHGSGGSCNTHRRPGRRGSAPWG